MPFLGWYKIYVDAENGLLKYSNRTIARPVISGGLKYSQNMRTIG